MIAAKVKKLSNANIIDEQDMIFKLTSLEYVARLNQILESNPILIEEKSVPFWKSWAVTW